MTVPEAYRDAELYPILIAPHPMLRRKVRPVGPADMERVAALLPRMFHTMYHAPGVGLAAPQIGVDLRVVVMDVKAEGEPEPIALINPEVIAESDEMVEREEGCLSLPGQYMEIVRPARVRVRYLDQFNKRQEIEGDGLLAACLQHEIDHLNGVLFVDHLSTLKRNMVLRKLAKEQRRKSDP